MSGALPEVVSPDKVPHKGTLGQSTGQDTEETGV